MSKEPTVMSVQDVANVPPNPDYPARMEIDYPAKSSRLLLFFRGIISFPQWVVLILLAIPALIGALLAWIIVLITARYPRSIFHFMAGILRQGHRLMAYQLLLTDRYPPFGLGDKESYPVRIQIDEPPNMHIHRWRALLQFIIAYPAQLAGGVILFLGYICAILAFFAILITGHYPKWIFRLVTVGLRWSLRTTAFQYLMTERYPPFVWA
jgi:Domain of unknown function (DUF4389)